MSNNAELDLALATSIDPRVEKPNTLYHVGVSGGKDSTAALLWMKYKSGIDLSKIQVTFCDTKNEHDWTYEHIRMLNEKVFPIKTLEPEMGFYDLALDRHRFPSACARFCTEELKIIVTANHLISLKAQGFDIIAVSGVRADESEDRSKLPEWAYAANMRCFQWRPLIRWTIKEVFAIHEEFNVPLNPLYAIGAQRVGCFPCIMSRKEEIRLIALKFPERIDAIRKAEQEFLKRYGRYSSFFASDKIPERFRSMPFTTEDGRTMNVATIDDVVKWSMTGERAQGHYTDTPSQKENACTSGYCE